MADRPFVSPRRLKEFFKLLLKEKLDTVEEIEANTDVGKFAGAMALKEVNDSLQADNGQGFKFSYDSESNKYGYTVTDGAGADTFCPFRQDYEIKIVDLPITISHYNPSVTYDISLDGYTPIGAGISTCGTSCTQAIYSSAFACSLTDETLVVSVSGSWQASVPSVYCNAKIFYIKK